MILRKSIWHYKALFAEEDLPRHAFYGDGSPIENAIIEEIRAIYDTHRTTFPWQKNDVMLLDNMLAAHGRTPYTGERQIVVAMAESYRNIKA